MAHAFNLSTLEAEAEAGRFLSSKPAWSTKWVLLNRETLSQKTKPNQTKPKKKFPLMFSPVPWLAIWHDAVWLRLILCGYLVNMASPLKSLSFLYRVGHFVPSSLRRMLPVLPLSPASGPSSCLEPLVLLCKFGGISLPVLFFFSRWLHNV